MNIVLTMFLVLMTNVTLAADVDMVWLRKLYYSSVSDKEASERFLKVMNDMQVAGSPVLTAYKGMANMMKANLSYNPYHKLSYFRKGRVLLDAAIGMDSTNIEVRFMRFSVQTNTPSFLQYNGAIAKDQKFLIAHADRISDADLKGRIVNYILTSGNCSSEERAMLARQYGAVYESSKRKKSE